jgi:hypothetical protein
MPRILRLLLTVCAHAPRARAWRVVLLESYSAMTAIRNWHELNVARSEPHDFSALLAPDDKSFYMAIVQHDEIRAIARCKHNRALCTRHVDGVATSPAHGHAGAILLKMLSERPYIVDVKALRWQPRWVYEALYLKSRLFETGA